MHISHLLHHETLKHSPFDVTILTLDAAIPALSAEFLVILAIALLV